MVVLQYLHTELANCGPPVELIELAHCGPIYTHRASSLCLKYLPKELVHCGPISTQRESSLWSYIPLDLAHWGPIY